MSATFPVRVEERGARLETRSARPTTGLDTPLRAYPTGGAVPVRVEERGARLETRSARPTTGLDTPMRAYPTCGAVPVRVEERGARLETLDRRSRDAASPLLDPHIARRAAR